MGWKIFQLKPVHRLRIRIQSTSMYTSAVAKIERILWFLLALIIQLLLDFEKLGVKV